MKQMNFSDSTVRIRNHDYSVDNTSNVTAEDVRRIGGIKRGRQIQYLTPNGAEEMKEGRHYSVPKASKFVDSPAVRKASDFSGDNYSYSHQREKWANEVIRQNLKDLEQKFFKDDDAIYVDNLDNPRIVMFKNFRLPKATRDLNDGLTETPVVLVLPDQYPFLPPVGFFMKEGIEAGRHRMHNDYVGEGGYQIDDFELFGERYRWYCSHVVAETWDPPHFKTIDDWRQGDNLWQIMTMISEVLSDFSDDDDY